MHDFLASLSVAVHPAFFCSLASLRLSSPLKRTMSANCRGDKRHGSLTIESLDVSDKFYGRAVNILAGDKPTSIIDAIEGESATSLVMRVKIACFHAQNRGTTSKNLNIVILFQIRSLQHRQAKCRAEKYVHMQSERGTFIGHNLTGCSAH